jgi:hypothetical protein
MRLLHNRWLPALALAAALCALPFSVRADEAPASATCDCNPLKQAFTDQLRAVELSRYAAMTSNNLDALSGMLGDDLAYADYNGGVASKQNFLDELRQGRLRYHSIKVLQQSVRLYGEIAIVNGQGKFDLTIAGYFQTGEKNPHQDVSKMLVYTSMYMQRGEGLKHWELIS